jgi:uncharacterized protein (TIGR03435 family)
MRVITAVILAVAAQAQQQPAARAEFEVVSVKPGDPAFPGSGVTTFPGRLVMRRTTLKNLLVTAFRLSDYQIAGGPKWMESTKFDIDAKLPAGAPMSQAPAMMQAMLADRFQLKSHRETRTVREYELVVSKGGPKFPEVDSGDHPGAGTYQDPNEILGRGRPISDLAHMLIDAADAPVIDHTGLKGQYDFALKFAPPSVTAEANDGLQPIFAVLQQKLGLKLNSLKGPVEVLVIDHAEMPTAN